MWFFQNDLASRFLERISSDPNSEPDRVVGIVLGAMLDDRLTQVIHSKLHYNKKLFDEAFRETGPLGPFGIQADLGFMLGIYNIETHTDLKQIIKIRNKFAHSLEAETFDSQGIREHVDNLSDPVDRTVVAPNGATYSFDMGGATLVDRRTKFVSLISLLSGLFYLELNVFAGDPLRNPRF